MSEPSAPATLQFVPLMGRRGRFSVTSIYQWKPYTFEVEFQVLDIPETYNFLLGRPWVHSAGLSSLKPSSEKKIHRSGSSGRFSNESSYILNTFNEYLTFSLYLFCSTSTHSSVGSDLALLIPKRYDKQRSSFYAKYR